MPDDFFLVFIPFLLSFLSCLSFRFSSCLLVMEQKNIFVLFRGSLISLSDFQDEDTRSEILDD